MTEVATDIWEIGYNDPDYPGILKEIADAPRKLYVRGNLDWMGGKKIAVVGSRKPTPYGVQATARLIEPVARSCVIISGLAYGVDSLAHQAALKAGGITVAILGSGLDDNSIYPARHLGLAHEILRSGGALISEHPPGTPPMKHHFPLRNRIIAGLADRLVVIEAGEGSGALITAKLALDYNRDVLAMPGQIFSPNSYGTNWLITQGAQPVLKPSDIADIASQKDATNLTEVEKIIYNTLVPGPKLLDEIVQVSGLAISIVNSTLTMLEMKGLVMNTGKGTFAVASTQNNE